jgi:predicted nucleic acid-binding Zn finger protein
MRIDEYMATLADFMTRFEKAQALLNEGKVHPVPGKPGLFVVKGQEKKTYYIVELKGETCTCPAFAHGKTRPCEHLIAAALYEHKHGSTP